jgi:peptide/nickel transport system substrate-binding protein
MRTDAAPQHRSSPRHRSSIVVIAVMTAFLFVVGACSKSGDDSSDAEANTVEAQDVGLESEGTPQTGGTVVMAVTAETNGWNPALSQWADAGNFVGSSFLEPLFVYNAAGDVVPWLAVSGTPTDDTAQNWIIKIRPGINFQDGTEMKAAALKQSIELSIFEGLSSIALGKLLDEVVVVDDYTFEVRLNVRWAQFLNVLAGPTGYTMAPSMMNTPNKGVDDPVGTGPFSFESWVPDKSVKVNKFDGYWGGPCALTDPGPEVTQLCEEAGVPLGQKNGPYLDAMEFRPIPDALQRANALESGDLNLIMSTRAADVARLKSTYQVVTDYTSERTLVMLNTREAPFDNIHARKALAMGTDRAAIADTVSEGEELGMDTSPFAEESRWGGLAPDETGYPAYDPEAARQEIEQYKADTGQPNLSFTFSGLATTDDIALQQSLLEQWRAIGVDAKIDTIEQTAYIGKLVGTDFQAAFFRWYAYPDPDSNYVFWSKETANPAEAIQLNFTGYSSATTENAVTWGRTASSFEARQPGYTQLVMDRNEAAVDLWLFNTPYSLIGETNIRGLNWFRSIGFGNFLPKPWIGGLWIDQSAASTSG